MTGHRTDLPPAERPIVAAAIRDLTAIGVQTRSAAALALRRWPRNSLLTDVERAAVLAAWGDPRDWIRGGGR